MTADTQVAMKAGGHMRTHARAFCSYIIDTAVQLHTKCVYNICTPFCYNHTEDAYLPIAFSIFFKRSIGSVTASSIRFAYARHAFETLAHLGQSRS